MPGCSKHTCTAARHTRQSDHESHHIARGWAKGYYMRHRKRFLHVKVLSQNVFAASSPCLLSRGLSKLFMPDEK